MFRQASAAGPQRADVQGLRALAVLAVVAYHGGAILPGGFIGVDVFFVVSGFVISGLVVRQFDDTVGIDLRDFYSRRIRRIMPALAVTLLVCLAFSVLVLSPIASQQVAARTATATSLVSANFFLFRNSGGYFAPASELNPFLHMWSLAVEEQFYLMFPLSIALLWRLTRRRLGRAWAARVSVGLLIVAFVGSLLGSVVLTAQRHALGIEDSISFAFYASPVRAWEFLAGVFVTLGARRLDALSLAARRALSVLGLALVVFTCVAYTGATRFPGLGALPPVLGTAALIAAGSGDRRGHLPLLGSRPLVWIGDRSYSWYLWHWPFVVAARYLVSGRSWVLLVAATVAIVPAMVSYRLVEQPFRLRGAWRGRRLVALGAACTLVPIGLATIVKTGATHHWGSDRVAVAATQNELHVDEVRGCDADHGLRYDRCRWPAATGVAAPATPAGLVPLVVLIGDSNAGMLTEPVRDAATAMGYEFRVSTRHGCPFAELKLAVGVNDGADCLASVDAVLTDATEFRPALVVLVSATDRYIDGTDNTFALPGQPAVSTPDAKAKVWAEAMRPVVARLAKGGTRVLVVHPVPRFGNWSLSGCSTIALVRNSCSRSVPTAMSITRRAAATTAERTAIGSAAGVRDVDFTGQLCTDVCRTDDAGGWIFNDASHLSIGGAMRLLDPLTTEMRAALA